MDEGGSGRALHRMLFALPARSPSASEHPFRAWLGFTLVLSCWLVAVEGFDLLADVGFQQWRRDADEPMKRAAIVGGAWAISALCLSIVCCHANSIVRRIAFSWLFVTTAITLSYRGLNGVGFRLHEAILMLTEANYAADSLRFFFGRYAVWIAGALLSTWLLAFLAARTTARIRPLWLCLLPLLGLWICREVQIGTEGKVQAFPTPFRVPLLMMHANEQRFPFYGEREAPAFATGQAPVASHIVLIVDESVSGDLLAINGGVEGTTPFLDELATTSAGFFNWGVVSSISNLSSTTNIVLQSGLQPNQLPDTALQSLMSPSVFNYMKQAGFSTYYFDAQTYAEPSNYLTRFDVDALDGFFQILRLEAGASKYELDRRIIERLAVRIESDDQSFSYVLKSGAHIHYEGRYPESERFFEPTLEAGELIKMDFRGADRKKTLNSYLNTLRWTVDGFWRELVSSLEATGKDVIVIYTSDHGQSLLEASRPDGSVERLSHNTPEDPPSLQAMVPLFAFAVGDGARGWLKERFDPTLRDAIDQFAIFPSLLVAAGYDEASVRARHGPNMFDREAARETRFFGSGDHLGRTGFQLNPYNPTLRPLPEGLVRAIASYDRVRAATPQ